MAILKLNDVMTTIDTVFYPFWESCPARLEPDMTKRIYLSACQQCNNKSTCPVYTAVVHHVSMGSFIDNMDFYILPMNGEDTPACNIGLKRVILK